MGRAGMLDRMEESQGGCLACGVTNRAERSLSRSDRGGGLYQTMHAWFVALAISA